MAYILCWGGIGRRVLLKLQSDPGCFRMKTVGGVVTHIFPGTFWLKMKKLTQGPVLKTKPNQQQKPKDQRYTESDTLFPRTYRAGSNSQHCPRSKALQNPNKKIPVTNDYVNPGSAPGEEGKVCFLFLFSWARIPGWAQTWSSLPLLPKGLGWQVCATMPDISMVCQCCLH